MKPKILHCAYSGLGGHAAALFTLLTSRLRDEYDHFVIFYGIEDLCDEYAESCEALGIPYRFIKKEGKVDAGGHRAVLDTIQRESPDVVMINGTPLAIPILLHRAVKRKSWRVVVRESQANHCKSRIEWLGSKLAARLADVVVYLTAEFRNEVDAQLRFPLTRRSEMRVIPNGVNLAEISPRRTGDPERFRISMVSRLVPIKDYETLIDAVHLLHAEHGRDVELHIAGDGPMRPALEERVAVRGISGVVTFHGLLSKPEVIALLRSSDLYAHCTMGEGMSNSILQAMAAQLPIVASDVRGVTNLLRHQQDGILVPPRDAMRLAQEIETLIQNPDERNRLAAAARQRIEAEYSQDRVIAEYGALFDKLVQREKIAAVSA